MAESLVSGLAQTVTVNLSSLVIKEIGLAWGLTDELKKLESIFKTIQAELQDAENKQRQNMAIQNWLGKLKNAAYDVENILDQIATEDHRRSLDSEKGTFSRIKSCLSSQNSLSFRSNMAHKVKNIREKLDAIANERHQFHLNESSLENRFGVTLESRLTSSLVNEMEICGRNEEKEMIIKELIDIQREQNDLSVYAVWGMGGIGKTTLAQLVYNDEKTKSRFELPIWVCVSDDFSIQRLVSAIIESIEGSACNVSGLDPLQRRLQDKLRGQRFLLVLDDVWNENLRLWDDLKEVLRCGKKGSMIMVTTRNEQIATMMTTKGDRRHIESLSPEDSWSLFKRRAFANGEEKENLATIGKDIVKKCGGLPLALNALGSLMRFKSHEDKWLAIQKSEIWNLSDDENKILPALRLSYDNLSPQMRKCFAYCSIFPKDFEMEDNQLIQLWMANGFLSSESQSDLYSTGLSIFEELVWRSFLQDVKINRWGQRMCKMHDLMHDLAFSVMQNETYIMEHDKVPKIPKMLRHLCFDLTSSEVLLTNEIKLPVEDSLRSFIVHQGHYAGFKEGFFSFLSKQQYVRVLGMNTFYKKIPSLVCKLKYLRYLVMSCGNLKRLPESLTCLLNLQTLKLTDSYGLRELPRGLKVMKNLWFLEMDSFMSLVCTPPDLRDLTCLRSLSIFIVGQDRSNQIDQLKELNLGGKLTIKGLENVKSLEDAKSANLIRKRDLTSLKLYWNNDIIENTATYFEEILEGLQPHEGLEEICISSYKGSRFPNWMSTLAFKNLKKISLENCGIEHLPSFGNFPSLKYLYLNEMSSIKHLCIEEPADGESLFPALTELTIRRMPNLEEWSITGSIESFPCLEELLIEECPKLKGLPFLPTLSSYKGYRFPNWMSTSAFKNLNKISLENYGIEHLPSFGNLPSLKCLYLEGMSSIKYLCIEEPADGESLFPALTELTILRIPNLEEWSITGSIESFPCLEELVIGGCPKLKGLPFLPSLRSLDIYDSSRALVQSITSLTSLESLALSNFPDLDVLPIGLLQNNMSLQQLHLRNLPIKTLTNITENLSALRHLNLFGCSNLEFVAEGLQHLKSLDTLRIGSCNGIRLFPAAILESFSSLRYLSFHDCEKLNPLSGPLVRGTILNYLSIIGLPELKHLPESMQQLSGLRNLQILECEGLCYLPNWIGSLHSLSKLHIRGCKKLKSLPDGFQSLKSLRELCINHCPDLEKRCKKPKGQDWPKISHIPRIEINGETIQYLYQ